MYLAGENTKAVSKDAAIGALRVAAGAGPIGVVAGIAMGQIFGAIARDKHAKAKRAAEKATIATQVDDIINDYQAYFYANPDLVNACEKNKWLPAQGATPYEFGRIHWRFKGENEKRAPPPEIDISMPRPSFETRFCKKSGVSQTLKALRASKPIQRAWLENLGPEFDALYKIHFGTDPIPGVKRPAPASPQESAATPETVQTAPPATPIASTENATPPPPAIMPDMSRQFAPSPVSASIISEPARITEREPMKNNGLTWIALGALALLALG